MGDNGVATGTLHRADLVAFTCLKAYTVEQRDERKDAHDLIYCLTYYEGGLDAAAAAFRAALEGKNKEVVREVLGLMARHLAEDGKTEGYLKTGPVAVSKFALGENEASRDDRIRRQRDIPDLVMRFPKAVG